MVTKSGGTSRKIEARSKHRRYLRTRIESGFFLILEARGFKRVHFVYGDPGWRVTKGEILLERHQSDAIDYVSFGFDKWGAPCFQINFGRSLLTEGHDRVRSANLVVRSSQYYHFWGKPWWMPLRTWSDREAEVTIQSALQHIDQIFRFLEFGERGANISREILPTTPGEQLRLSVTQLLLIRALAILSGLAFALVPLLFAHHELSALVAYTFGEFFALSLVFKAVAESGWKRLATNLLLGVLWIAGLWQFFLPP